MPSYLVIAHQTAQSPQLIRALKEKQQANAATEFVLLVPVTPFEDLRVPQAGSMRDVARRAASEAAVVLKDNGIQLRWTVISEYTPAVALGAELSDHPQQYDGVILSTYPEGTSRWMDEHISAVAASHGLPITQIITNPEAVR